MVLRDNMFVEKFLPGATLRPLADAEMNEYRRPFLNAGEDRRPMLSWPRQIPIDGSPSDTRSGSRKVRHLNFIFTPIRELWM